jgi:hypothetical protein
MFVTKAKSAAPEGFACKYWTRVEVNNTKNALDHVRIRIGKVLILIIFFSLLSFVLGRICPMARAAIFFFSSSALVHSGKRQVVSQ